METLPKNKSNDKVKNKKSIIRKVLNTGIKNREINKENETINA